MWVGGWCVGGCEATVGAEGVFAGDVRRTTYVAVDRNDACALRAGRLRDEGFEPRAEIVNAGQLAVYEELEPDLRELVEDVLFNRRPEATERLVDYAGRVKSKGKVAPDAEAWRSAPVDFEACADTAEKARTKEDKTAALAECNAKFAGRRKPSGGYTYYDFMQDRTFDIAGPNPPPEAQK